MYAALLNGKLVLAIQEAMLVLKREKTLNYVDYRCPKCKKKMLLIILENKAAFFKHVANYEKMLGEKEEHHSAKLLLKTAFTAAGFNAQVEVPLAENKLRADVLVSNKLALEVQCAPLSTKEFKIRHQLYRKNGVLDLWIVGQRHYLTLNLKKTQLIFFRNNDQWGTYYLEVNPQKEQLILKYNVKQEPVTRKIHYQLKTFRLDEIGIKKFWNFTPNKKSYQLNGVEQRKYVKKQIRQKSKIGLKIAQQLYQQQLTLKAIPDDVFLTWRKPGATNSVLNFLTKKLTHQR